MSAFTDAEIEFVNSQRLGRLATVGANEMPHVVPVAVFYDTDAGALFIGANAQFGEAVMTSSKKFRDAQRRPKEAPVLDDPGPRILEVRGHAETHLDGGEEAGKFGTEEALWARTGRRSNICRSYTSGAPRIAALLQRRGAGLERRPVDRGHHQLATSWLFPR
jgi:pyridoxamine 5'-phosphate oxidase family protein